MLWKKKKKTLRKQLSPYEKFERYNNSLFEREQARLEMMTVARRLEKKRKMGREYVA